MWLAGEFMDNRKNGKNGKEEEKTMLLNIMRKCHELHFGPFSSPASPPPQCWLQSSLSLYDTCYTMVECHMLISAILTASTSAWYTDGYDKKLTTEWKRKLFFPKSQSVCLVFFLSFVSHWSFLLIKVNFLLHFIYLLIKDIFLIGIPSHLFF